MIRINSTVDCDVIDCKASAFVQLVWNLHTGLDSDAIHQMWEVDNKSIPTGWIVYLSHWDKPSWDHDTALQVQSTREQGLCLCPIHRHLESKI